MSFLKRTGLLATLLAVVMASGIWFGPGMAQADAKCGGITNPCGIVYNRSGATLQLSRDSGSHLTCQPRGPYRNLPSGRNSNAYGSPHWPDVDCFRSLNRKIFTNGRIYSPGTWIRVWTSKWVYSV